MYCNLIGDTDYCGTYTEAKTKFNSIDKAARLYLTKLYDCVLLIDMFNCIDSTNRYTENDNGGSCSNTFLKGFKILMTWDINNIGGLIFPKRMTQEVWFKGHKSSANDAFTGSYIEYGVDPTDNVKYRVHKLSDEEKANHPGKEYSIDRYYDSSASSTVNNLHYKLLVRSPYYVFGINFIDNLASWWK